MIIDRHDLARQPALRFLRRHGHAVDRLADSTGAPLYARSHWLQASLDSDQGHTAFAVPIWELPSNCLSGLLLFSVQSGGMFHNVGPRVPFCVAQSPSAVQRAIRALQQLLPDVACRGGVFDVEPSDPVTEVLPASFARCAIEAAHHVPGLRIDPGASLRDLLGSSMFRHVSRARRRAAGEDVMLRCETIRDHRQIRALLPEIAELHRDRDHSRGADSDLDDNRALHNWRKVVHLQSSIGQAVVFALRLNGELAAYAIGFLDGSAIRVFDGRSSRRWSRYSPGRVIEARMIQWAIDSNAVALIDWMSPQYPEALIGWNCVQEYVRYRLAAPIPLIDSATV